jgi:hypothetical protein
MAGLGAVQVCELELSYVSVGEMKGEKITVPVNVNVVPGDVAAGSRLTVAALAIVPPRRCCR